MMRALLQRELDAVQLDRWFETVAKQQYTRKLLFSTLFELMTQGVLEQAALVPLKRYAKATARKTAPRPAPSGCTIRRSPICRWPSCWQPRHLEITRQGPSAGML